MQHSANSLVVVISCCRPLHILMYQHWTGNLLFAVHVQ